MEKKTMETLRTMICGELEDIAKNGIKSHENLDILKDLLDSAKNLEKIEKYQREKEETEYEMDRGYSQRKYYIDADYDPYNPMNSYARGGRTMYDMQGGNSYAIDRNRAASALYGNGNGNSYMYYDPMYSQARYPMSMSNGYSNGGNTDAISELTKMMAEAPDEITKKAISDAITKLNK
jgi:hypothetical protein